MAHGVFHKDLGAINLSDLDLTVKEDRLLWESLHGKTERGDLACLECRERDPGCPQWMFLRLWKGRPVAVHYSDGRRHASAPESPRHRALKDCFARAADRAGYRADLEARAPDGRRRTDVLIHGEDGLKLGCEIQLSYTTPRSVARRTDIARADGLSPLWTTDDKSSPLIDRAPWARIDRLPLEAFSSGNALLVRGGVKELKLTRCDSRNPLPCPDRGHGRCNRWHATWVPTRGMHLDRLVAVTAASEYLPLYLPSQSSRRPVHMWVSREDREQYLDATTDTLAEPVPGTVDDNDPAAPERLPLSRACTYQQREDDKPRANVTRDTGALLPAGITLDAPPTIPTRSRRTSTAPDAATPPHRDPSPPGPTASPRPAALPGPRRPRERWAIAADLGCTPAQVGPCASCQEATHRYGHGGNPLCTPCRTARSRR